MTERRLQSAVAGYLRAVLTAETFATAIPGGDGQMTTAPGYVSGTPDYLIVHNGKALFIELKTPRGRLSDAQIDTMHAVENADSVVKVCRSVEDVAAVLAQFRIPTRGRIAA